MQKYRTYKILLADDEPQNIKGLFDALKRDDYQLFTAPNGKIALELALKHLPDAIIMDWDMPVMNGMDAIRGIRSNETTKNIPVIVATGKMTKVEHLKTALEAGANDYIRKPFDLIEIEARVKSMIRLNDEHQKNTELENQLATQRITSLKHELEINRQALYTAKLRLIYDSQKTSALIHDLLELKNSVDDNGKMLIGKIISNCKTKSTIFNWEEFETLFEKVHPSFYLTLYKKIPDLNNSESKLCAFVRLNMTTKEISEVSFQKYDTVKKTKHRLKKKFDLRAEESLYQFIQAI